MFLLCVFDAVNVRFRAIFPDVITITLIYDLTTYHSKERCTASNSLRVYIFNICFEYRLTSHTIRETLNYFAKLGKSFRRFRKQNKCGQGIVVENILREINVET